MEERWSTNPTFDSGGELVGFNLSQELDDDAFRLRPHALRVRLAIDDSGDTVELDALGDAVLERLSDAAVHAGRSFDAEQWDWLAYLADGTQGQAEAVAREIFPAGAEITCDPDPLGEIYARHFVPSPEQQHSGADMLVLGALLGQGDPCSEPRDVDHVLTFDDEAATAGAAQALESAGLAVHPTDRSATHLVVVDHVIPTPQTIAAGRQRILDAAAAWPANYDGWGCAAVAKPKGLRGLLRRRS